MKLSIVNLEANRRLFIKTNARIEITSNHPNFAGPNGVESIGPDDVLNVMTEREVRIELRGDSLSVIVL